MKMKHCELINVAELGKPKQRSIWWYCYIIRLICAIGLAYGSFVLSDLL